MPIKAINKREIMVRVLSVGSSPEGCLKAEHLQLLQKLSMEGFFLLKTICGVDMCCDLGLKNMQERTSTHRTYKDFGFWLLAYVHMRS